MTRLSIVIPCLRGAEQAEETLISVLSSRPADCEVLVPHGDPYDDPYDLSGEVRFVHCRGTSALVSLINAAVEEAQGDIVHVLACGMQVEDGWADRALAHFADPRVGAVAPLVVQAQQPTRIDSLGVRYTRGGRRIMVGRDLPLPRRHKLAGQVIGPSLGAGFFDRELLDALCGFADNLGDELADVDLALSLAELGFRTACEPACRIMAIAAAGQASGDSAISSGRHSERLFLRHAAAHGGIGAILAHPFSIAADAIAELPSLGAIGKLIGRAIATWEFGTVQAYKERMAEAAEYLRHEPLPPAGANRAGAIAPPNESSLRRAA